MKNGKNTNQVSKLTKKVEEMGKLNFNGDFLGKKQININKNQLDKLIDEFESENNNNLSMPKKFSDFLIEKNESRDFTNLNDDKYQVCFFKDHIELCLDTHKIHIKKISYLCDTVELCFYPRDTIKKSNSSKEIMEPGLVENFDILCNAYLSNNLYTYSESISEFLLKFVENNQIPKPLNLKNYVLNLLCFSGSNLLCSNFTSSTITGCVFEKVNFFAANFFKSTAIKTNFSQAKFISANFEEATMKECDLVGANLKNANLSNMDLRGSNLSFLADNTKVIQFINVLVDESAFNLTQDVKTKAYIKLRMCDQRRKMRDLDSKQLLNQIVSELQKDINSILMQKTQNFEGNNNVHNLLAYINANHQEENPTQKTEINLHFEQHIEHVDTLLTPCVTASQINANAMSIRATPNNVSEATSLPAKIAMPTLKHESIPFKNYVDLLRLSVQQEFTPEMLLKLVEELLARVTIEMDTFTSARTSRTQLALQAAALLSDVCLERGISVDPDYRELWSKTRALLNRKFRVYRDECTIHDFWGQYLLRSMSNLLLETPEREKTFKKHGVDQIMRTIGHGGKSLLYAGVGTTYLGVAIPAAITVGAFYLLPSAVSSFCEGWAKPIRFGYKLGKNLSEALRPEKTFYPTVQVLPKHLVQVQTLSSEEIESIKGLWDTLATQLTQPVNLDELTQKIEIIKKMRATLKEAKANLKNAEALSKKKKDEVTITLKKAKTDLKNARVSLTEALNVCEQQVYTITELILQARTLIPAELGLEEKNQTWLVSLYQAHAAHPHVQQFILWRMLMLLNEQWAALSPSIDNEAIQTEDLTALIKKLLGPYALEESKCAEAIDYYNQFIKPDKSLGDALIKNRKAREKDFVINHLKSDEKKRKSYIAYGQLLDNFHKIKPYFEDSEAASFLDVTILEEVWFKIFPKDEAIYTVLGHYQESQRLVAAIAELGKEGVGQGDEKKDELIQLHYKILGRIKQILGEMKDVDTTLLSCWGNALLQELSEAFAPYLAAIEQMLKEQPEKEAFPQSSALITIGKGGEMNVGYQHWGDIFRFSQMDPDEASKLDATLKANKREDEQLRQEGRIKPMPVLAIFGKLNVLEQQFGNIVEQQQSAAEKSAADGARNARLVEQMQQAFNLSAVSNQQVSSGVPFSSVGQLAPKVGGSPIHSPRSGAINVVIPVFTATTAPIKSAEKPYYLVNLNFNVLEALDDDQMNTLAIAIKTHLGKRASLFKKDSEKISDMGDYICAGFSTEEAANRFREFVEQQVVILIQAQKLSVSTLGKQMALFEYK